MWGKNGFTNNNIHNVRSLNNNCYRDAGIYQLEVSDYQKICIYTREQQCFSVSASTDYRSSICEQTTFNWNIYDPMYTDVDLRVSQCTLYIQMQEAISCRRNVDHGNVNGR